jgi:hypothetical protein
LASIDQVASAREPEDAKMSGISKSEYIRWVKGSLNRLLGASLPDDGNNTPEYRMWLMSFQTNQKLTVNAKVDLATQNALIKRNRYHDGYVRWVQNALLISGEGIRVWGKAIVANGYWGVDTEQAVKDFQSKHEKMKDGDGWVGAKTERALMLRTGTVPPGRTRVLRSDPGYIPVFNDDGPLGPAEPADDIPELTAEGFRFAGSQGHDLSAGLYGISSGSIDLLDLSKNKTVRLSYAALGLGKSNVPAAYNFTNEQTNCTGEVYPNPIHGQAELTMGDITGWCLIYQAQWAAGGGMGATRMFLSMGAGLVSGFLASMTGIGTLVAPALMVRSCRAIVAFRGTVLGTPNASLSGAVGYLSLGDARAHVEKIKDLVGA